MRYRYQNSYRGKEALLLASLPHHLSYIQHYCDDRNDQYGGQRDAPKAEQRRNEHHPDQRERCHEPGVLQVQTKDGLALQSLMRLRCGRPLCACRFMASICILRCAGCLALCGTHRSRSAAPTALDHHADHEERCPDRDQANDEHQHLPCYRLREVSALHRCLLFLTSRRRPPPLHFSLIVSLRVCSRSKPEHDLLCRFPLFCRSLREDP